MARKKQSRKQTKSNPLPVLLLVAGGLLLLAALVLILTRNNPSTGTASSANPEERVSLVRAKAAFDAGEAVFVDVRGPAGYNAGHVPGAVLIPLNEFEDRWDELDPNDWIITYCT